MLFPKPYADAVAKLRVPSGFLLVAAFVWLAAPTLDSLAVGVPISIAGLLLRAWAAGHLAKNSELANGGPYRFVRNPLYAGTLVVAAGVVVATRRVELAILFGATFLLVYLPVIQNEEQHLRKIFPSYAKYAAQVPALIPYKPPVRSDRRFRPDLYVRNQEYQALLGYIAGLLLLVWKAI
ncbi:MAG TPA: methyltransferase [Bryobacteraceae bacterium]|nr:methyltransferase [Bryobacteraceae bacterium]